MTEALKDAGKRLLHIMERDRKADREAVALIAQRRQTEEEFRQQLELYFRNRRYGELHREAATIVKQVREQTLRELSEEEPNANGIERFYEKYAEGVEKRVASVRKNRILKATDKKRMWMPRGLIIKEDDEQCRQKKAITCINSENMHASAGFECARAVNVSKAEAYTDCGVECVWSADEGECEACRNMDGKTIKKGAKTPPMHKGCGCTIAIREQKRQNLKNVTCRDIIDAYEEALAERKVLRIDQIRNGLPNIGEPCSICDKVSLQGEVLQRRVYDKLGEWAIDIDTSNHGAEKQHPTGAHKHIADKSKKNPHGKPYGFTDEEIELNADIIQKGINYNDS